MNKPVFTEQQRQAMQWLGYQRWIVRDELADYQQAETNATKTAAALPQMHGSQTVPNLPMLNQPGAKHADILNAPLEKASNTTVNQASVAKVNTNKVNANKASVNGATAQAVTSQDSSVLVQSASEATKPMQASCEQPLTIDGVNFICTEKITLIYWQVETNANSLWIALPPLWGSSGKYQLFATQQERSLLANALTVCGLTDIASKLGVIEHYLTDHSLTLSEHNVNAITQLIPSQALIIMVNASLPLMTAFQETLSPDLQANVLGMIHPYHCLEQPNMKAVLWQQLTNIQDRINDD